MVGKLSSLLFRRTRKPVQMTMACAPKPPVQGELSLDKIKVVRNDLSDADLEVVPAKLPAAPKTTVPALPEAARPRAGGAAWPRWPSMFRAGKV